jgi:hypothetical protein
MMNGATVACLSLLAALTASAAASAGEPPQYREDANPRVAVLLAASSPMTVVLAPVAGFSGTAIPLNMKVPAEGLRFALFQDVPAEISFSHGFRLRKAWITAIHDLDELKIIVPPGFTGKLSIEVMYHYDNQGEAKAHGRLEVNVKPLQAIAELAPPQSQDRSEPATASIKPATPAPAPASALAPVPEQQPQPAVSMLTLSVEEESDNFKRGATRLQAGDIAGARLIFEYLADYGSAKGARALAETFDAAYLRHIPVVGGRLDDIEAAKKWYKRAAEMGDSKAATRLSVLDRR